MALVARKCDGCDPETGQARQNGTLGASWPVFHGFEHLADFECGGKYLLLLRLDLENLGGLDQSHQVQRIYIEFANVHRPEDALLDDSRLVGVHNVVWVEGSCTSEVCNFVSRVMERRIQVGYKFSDIFCDYLVLNIELLYADLALAYFRKQDRHLHRYYIDSRSNLVDFPADIVWLDLGLVAVELQLDYKPFSRKHGFEAAYKAREYVEPGIPAEQHPVEMRGHGSLRREEAG